jgi:hypothetical protein
MHCKSVEKYCCAMEGEQIAYINVFFVLYGLKYSIVLCMVRSCHCIVIIIFLYIVCADEKICKSVLPHM